MNGNRPRKKGFALAVGLMILLLLSGLTLAFLAFSQSKRRMINTSAAIQRVEQLSQTSLDTLLGDLMDEIVAGSNEASSNAAYPGQRYYLPKIPAAAVPQRLGDFGQPNLVKTSQAGKPFWQPWDAADAGGPVRVLSGNDTGTASANGVAVNPSRWMYPGLLGQTAPEFLTKGAAGYDAPDWIVVTRKGPLAITDPASPPSISVLKDRNSADYAIGRYAYAVYDAGGLLDISVAGSLLDKETQSRRFRSSQVPLDSTAIPGITDPSNLVKWRDRESFASDASFLLDPLQLFASLQSGQQAWVNRQDLLRFQKENSAWLGADALQYLTVFSRSLNRPYSKVPEQGALAAKIPAAVAARVPEVNYSTPSTFKNPQNFFEARRPDGSAVMKNRFPLNRLGLFSNPTGNASLIQKYFGLARAPDGYSWLYRGTETSQIKTLAEVAAESPAREPDFFEVLQAAILTGGLAQGNVDPIDDVVPKPAGSASKYGESLVESRERDRDLPRHVLQIGANILDQYDADDYPTLIKRTIMGRVSYSSSTKAAVKRADVAGIENIPYLSDVGWVMYRLNQNAPVAQRGEFGSWFTFEFWNPHQNAPEAGTGSATPSQFRVVMTEGIASLSVAKLDSTTASGKSAWFDTPPLDYYAAYAADPENTPYQVRFSNDAGFKDPQYLMPGKFNATTPGPGQSFPGEGGTSQGLIGILVGKETAYDRYFTGDPLDSASASLNFNLMVDGQNPGRRMTWEVQFRDAAGQWRTYQRFGNFEWVNAFSAITLDAATREGKYSSWSNGNIYLLGFNRLDPRGERWGLGLSNTSANINQPMLPGSDSQTVGCPDNPKYFVTNKTSSSGSLRLYPHAENIYKTAPTVNLPYMADRDGIVRRGDPVVTGVVAADQVDPLSIADANRFRERPLILNRPFRSVGELGYTFRDLPWKTLDFSSVQLDPADTTKKFACSADAALLDYFTCEDPYGSAADRSSDAALGETAVLRGKISLNSQNSQVLASAMGSAMKVVPATVNGAAIADAQRYLDAGSGSKVKALADAMAKATKASYDNTLGWTGAPLSGRGDLAGVLAAKCETELAAISRTKTEREAPLRALADCGDTQTWNLLIDVIVQSGRYGPLAASADGSQFQVEAERRYWLHVAIDRATGEVIDHMLETVDE
jgi:hypothetical protein